jgi:hypothetical protein
MRFCFRLKLLFAIVVFAFGGCQIYAQLTDLARLEYSFIPSSRSEDQYTRLRAILNYPIKIKNENYVIVGAEYNRIILNLEEPYPFDTSVLDRLHVIDLNLGYTFETKRDWRLGFQFNPRIASTLTRGITASDIFFNGGIYAIKDRTNSADGSKPNRLILGLTYNTTVGVPFPLPFISYYRKINDKWSYSAGIPKSNLKYFFSDRAILQGFALLDGYFANLQQPITVNGKTAENISLSVAVAGLGFEYMLTKHLVAYSYSGFTFRLDNVLRNNNRDEIFRLDNLNAFYLRTGIKFKI